MDTSRLPKRLGPRWRRANANNAGLRTDEDPSKVSHLSRNMQKAVNTASHNKRYTRLQRARMDSRRRWAGGPVWTAPSVAIDPAWSLVDETEPSQLASKEAEVPAAEDLCANGSLRSSTDAVANRIAKRESIAVDGRVFHPFVPTKADAGLRDLMAAGAGTVYATDAAVSQLMVAQRAKRPWDIVFTVYGGSVILIDARSGSAQAELELEPVHETAFKPPEARDPTDINQARQLAIEATCATRAFREALVEGGKTHTKIPKSGGVAVAAPGITARCPAGQAMESVTHRYRRFALGDEQVVIRTSLHATARTSGSSKSKTVYAAALPERWESRAVASEWRKSFRDRPGDILLSELRDNAAKVGRWIAHTHLAGADELHLGFVTRRSRDDASAHDVVGTQSYSPEPLANQMSLPLSAMWGSLNWAISLVRHQVSEMQAAKRDAGALAGDEEDSDDYKYLMMYFPETETGAKACIRLYEIRSTDYEGEAEPAAKSR